MHQRRELPEEIAEFTLDNNRETVSLADLLVKSGLAPSKSEARRLIKAGAVYVDGSRVTEAAATVGVEAQQFVLRCGKLGFRRIKIQ